MNRSRTDTVDHTTVELAKRGQRAAQAELLRELQDVWYRSCLGLLGDADAAREATQETAVRFLRQLHAFRGDSHVRTWSLGIAINVTREMSRRPRPRNVGAPARPPDPATAAEDAERRDRLRSVLDGLPRRQREAVLLRFFEELTVKETAEAMNCAVGTVKAAVHQALRTMRERLKQLA